MVFFALFEQKINCFSADVVLGTNPHESVKNAGRTFFGRKTGTAAEHDGFNPSGHIVAVSAGVKQILHAVGHQRQLAAGNLVFFRLDNPVAYGSFVKQKFVVYLIEVVLLQIGFAFFYQFLQQARFDKGVVNLNNLNDVQSGKIGGNQPFLSAAFQQNVPPQLAPKGFFDFRGVVEFFV